MTCKDVLLNQQHGIGTDQNEVIEKIAPHHDQRMLGIHRHPEHNRYVRLKIAPAKTTTLEKAEAPNAPHRQYEQGEHKDKGAECAGKANEIQEITTFTWFGSGSR